MVGQTKEQIILVYFIDPVRVRFDCLCLSWVGLVYSYVSLQSFMSSEDSFKEFSFISYILYSNNCCDNWASSVHAIDALPPLPSTSV